MGRADYKRHITTCADGINQNAEKALSSECADAINMWSPNGRAVQRPGYVGIGKATSAVGSDALSNVLVTVENPIGTFVDTTVLGALPVGSRWYVGFSAQPSAAYPVGLDVPASPPNTNPMTAVVEYWNGTEWVFMRTSEADFTLAEAACGLTTTHLASPNEEDIFFVWPRDMAITTLVGASYSNTGYFFRFTMQALNGSTALSVGTQVSNPTVLSVAPSQIDRSWVVLAKLINSNRIIQHIRGVSGEEILSSSQLAGPLPGGVVFSHLIIKVGDAEPPSSAVVPQTNELYIAYNNRVTVHQPYAHQASDVAALATVETADFAVGSGAPFDPNYIAQRSDFPAAKYLLYFQNRFWFATDTTVGWSAAAPFEKVFPLLSEEPITGAGKVTGLAVLGEQVVVFTAESIWIMVLRGLNAFGTPEYIPTRRISGVGCYSNASIQQIRGELVFLGRDGLYGFDGSNIRKISSRQGVERLETFFASVSPGKRDRAVAANWKEKSYYLLGISVNGSSPNNRVLAWDYETDALWIWDDMEVCGWLETDDALYFHDLAARVFEFGKGDTDNGATITSSVTTQRLGYNTRTSKSIREVAIWSEQMAQSIIVDVLPNDSDSNKPGTMSLTDPSEKASSVLVVNVDNWTLPKRRLRKQGRWENCNHAQVKVTHSVKNTPWALSSIDVGMEETGMS